MSTAMDRRSFLGNTALGAAASSLTVSAKTRAKSPSANSRMVVGIMGMARGMDLAMSLGKQPNVHVKYVCDVDSLLLDKVAKKVEQELGRAPQKVTDFRRILDDSSVDLLANAAPNHWHCSATLLTCAAGKHVYVEKPCSHNPREGELMIQAARKYNRAVQVGTQRRSSPGTQEAIQQLHEGVIGRVYMARAWYNGGRGSQGWGKQVPVPAHLDYDLWQGPAPRVPYKDNLIHYNWHWYWHWGNGELGNNGVHTMDLCRWGLQVDYPTRVASSGGRYCFEDDQETPDTDTACFEFEGNRSISWAGLSCNRHGTGFITFYGAKGALDLASKGSYTIYDKDGKVVKKGAESTYGDDEHAENFLAAIRDDKPLRLNIDIEEGHKSTLLCQLANIAYRTGRSLDCDPNSGYIKSDPEAMKYWSRDYAEGWEPKV